VHAIPNAQAIRQPLELMRVSFSQNPNPEAAYPSHPPRSLQEEPQPFALESAPGEENHGIAGPDPERLPKIRPDRLPSHRAEPA
jgi:hypothetical protein